VPAIYTHIFIIITTLNPKLGTVIASENEEVADTVFGFCDTLGVCNRQLYRHVIDHLCNLGELLDRSSKFSGYFVFSTIQLLTYEEGTLDMGRTSYF
jgi:hypothetical protein